MMIPRSVEDGQNRYSQSPLRAKRRPGPPGADAVQGPEAALEDAARILELVEDGTLTQATLPPLNIPLNKMGKPTRKLTAEEESELGYRIQTWGDVDARNILVMANLGLVHLVANQLRRPGYRHEDLVQEGTLGLLRATETFEPDRGIRFSTYCVFWIRAKVQRLLQKNDREELPVVPGAEMQDNNGRRRRPRARALSLDAPVGTDDGEDRLFGDTIADGSFTPEHQVLQQQRDQAVDEALHDIALQLGDERLGVIIEERMLADEPATLAVLGEQLHLSREGARLLEGKVLRLARERLQRFHG
jgi:RNA polymerase sigma factor (sigma-70 family)